MGKGRRKRIKVEEDIVVDEGEGGEMMVEMEKEEGGKGNEMVLEEDGIR